MSLLYQILNPIEKSVPCVFPSSVFDYSFVLMDDSPFKIHFEPYPMSIESRFYKTVIEYAGLTGEGFASILKEDACLAFPPFTGEFTFNQTSYKVSVKNKKYVIGSGETDPALLNAASESLTCEMNATVYNDSNSVLGFPSRQLELQNDYACPSSPLYFALGLVVDCSVMRQSTSKEDVINEVLANLAKSNIAFKKFFNIQAVLTKLDVRTSCSEKYKGTNKDIDVEGEYDRWNVPCTSGYSLMNRVSDFAKWRGNKGKDGVDLWHLFSTCSTDGKVGLAWPSAMCYSDSAVATGNFVFSGVGVSTRQKTSWKVMAHEIAHNLGAPHDCLGTCAECCSCGDKCDCNGEYLMNPNQRVNSDDFSSCTVQSVCNQLPKFECLKTNTSSIRLFQANTCGNGIVDPGEECDCGDLCEGNNCCTKDCKLTSGSVCSDSNDSCCTSCTYKSKGVPCRKSEGVCDKEETCTGNSGSCPTDLFVPNGQSCNDNGFTGFCASKYCTSLDKQCSDVYSSSTGACSGFGQKSECSLTCNIRGACQSFDSFFIDGTPCGSGYGTCTRGSCLYANLGNFYSFRR